MPSKNSKRHPRSASPWKVANTCSETFLGSLARELAAELRPGHRVVLEGPMGAGKTTFARELLQGLGVRQPPEGSPSFAIAHEYDSRRGGVVHIDFYRLRAEEEIDEAGIPAYYWERELIVISEWLSLWPGFHKAVLEAGSCWKVTLSFPEDAEKDAGADLRRNVVIERLF